ncbi:transposase [Lipingzhangella sp. LS1_29]|uniref:Transposase n=1 Tax=Lipingzhangella rawalii TaxID=2055835 RepID=A0ABU2H637_9ACTN|nr:transposase [Lipingzhangella rawalii]MDS1270779.1 transposase [Lipingzhangella rawalii]
MPKTRSSVRLPNSAPSPPGSLGNEKVFQEVTRDLFASLPRSDQRRKGMNYLRGLLATPGRKSIRNMAALIGGTGTGQSLHHFICSSTWEPRAVQRALAGYLVREHPPQAWVARPVLIPKTGQYSAGVGQFCGTDGRVVNAQLAVGVWLVAARGCFPVSWRLHLPVDPQTGPHRATGPTPADCAADALLEVLEAWGLPPAPLLLELDGWDPVPALRRLRAAGLPSLARIGGETELAVADTSLVGHQNRVLPARQIMRAAQALRRPVTGRRLPSRSSRTVELAAPVRVSPPGESFRTGPGRGSGFVLVGSGSQGRHWPDRIRLTTLSPEQAVTGISRYSGLAERVDRSASEIGDRVGLRDFSGRSCNGWYRHVALVSAAHAIAELSENIEKPPATPAPPTSAPDEVLHTP